jgi:hypothetical protein
LPLQVIGALLAVQVSHHHQPLDAFASHTVHVGPDALDAEARVLLGASRYTRTPEGAFGRSGE